MHYLVAFALALFAALAQAQPVDESPPTVAIVHPHDGQRVGKQVVIEVRAEDDMTPLPWVVLVIDNAYVVLGTRTTRLQYFWDARDAAQGWHSIIAAALDDRGNQSVASIHVYVIGHEPEERP